MAQTVSAVIPTLGGATLRRAIDSVLAQTLPVLEIVVVADTDEPIDLPVDARITLHRVGPKAGGNTARQFGISIARGQFIALLDDDDEWLPTKLAEQFASGAMTTEGDPVISTTRIAIRRGDEPHSIVQPERALRDGEVLTHYLFRKSSPWAGHGMMQASTLVFPRWLGLAVPFDTSLKFHQDISWLIDVARAWPGLRVEQVWQPLVTYYSHAAGVSKNIGAQASADWAAVRLADDPRTHGDFVLTQSLGFARRSSGAKEQWAIVRRGASEGRPGLPALAYAAIQVGRSALRGAPQERIS